MNKTTQKHKRGGSRPGAGRPTKYTSPTVRYLRFIPEEIVKDMDKKRESLLRKFKKKKD